MKRLAFKKSVADAAVDGVVPEGHLRSEAQVYRDLMAWLDRLDSGDVEMIARPKITVPLPEEGQEVRERLRRRYGDFSKLNARWSRGASTTTHQRLQKNPEEWAHYHTLYSEARKEWAVVPFEEMIRFYTARSAMVIGDFGCGEAKLADALSERHTVHSFDHVAVNDDVIACDMAHVPLDDESLDAAVFCLSLMGSNFTDYLREAHRTLKLDGHVHIFEPTKKFSNREAFVRDIEKLGFGFFHVEERWVFTYIRAEKTTRPPDADIVLRF
jgi:hypothetical protein